MLLYVNGILILGSNFFGVNNLKKEMSNYFTIKDLGPIKHILSIRIIRDRKYKMLWLSQEKYIKKMVQQCSIAKAKVVSTPLATSFKLSANQSSSN